MPNRVSGCFDPLRQNFVLTTERRDEDQAWCSESCKQRVKHFIVKKYPCKQKFIRVDVTPLYECGVQRNYRVNLWVNNWATAMGPMPELWKTLYITLEGVDRRVTLIKEGKRKRLAIGENGQKLMDELSLYSE